MLLQDFWIGYIACTAAILVALLTALAIKPTGASQTTPAALRNSAMDGARGYLAIGVFFHHFGFAYNHLAGGMWMPPADRMLINLGPFAVMSFFMITAYLFYGRLSRLKHPSDWVRLYIGRFFRIAPMYLVSVTLALYAFFAFNKFNIQTGLDTLFVETSRWLALGWYPNTPWNGSGEAFIADAGVTWTLRYEWLFYLTLPVQAVLIYLIRWKWLRIIAIAALAVASRVYPLNAWGFESNITTPFIAGMLAWEILEFDKVRKFASSWMAAVIGLAAIYVNLVLTRQLTTEQLLTVFAFFVPIASGNGYFGMLTNRAARVLGEASFSMYLIHGIVLFVALRVLSALSILPHGAWGWMLVPTFMVPIVLLSVYGYRLVEVPGIATGKRIADGLRRSSTGTVAKPTSP